MTVLVACGRAANRSVAFKGSLQLLETDPQFAQTFAASGTSQATTAAVPERTGSTLIWAITNAGTGAIWVTFGASPTAAAGTTWLIPANDSGYYQAKPGQRCAIINA